MSDYRIRPHLLEGAVTPPASKSQLHRIMIARALSGTGLPASTEPESEDLTATRRCLEALMKGKKKLPLLDCGESGSTLRFLIPLALVLRGGAVFVGHGRLPERPIEPYVRLFEQQNIRFTREGNSLTVEGSLKAGEYRLPGDVSSQFITGLLFALPLLEGESRIVLTTPLESRSYVDLTLVVLKCFGVSIDMNENTFIVPGTQKFRADFVEAERDWSQGAFWYAANFLDHHVDVQGLNSNSIQGDRQIARWYWTMARPGDVELDMSQYPDLLPAVALMATVRAGETRLVKAGRLRDKESDRLAAVASVLKQLGAEVEELPDGLVLAGSTRFRGGVTVDSFGDHRIAMMAAIAASGCEDSVVIRNGDCVRKSYPEFWEHYRSLGGEFDVLVSGN